jgi:type IV pilus assembly protein PilE
MMRKKKNAGVTLIELMIAIAIIALLASIAIPLYDNQTSKARRTDARTALASIALAQERFFTVNGNYTTNLANLDVDVAIQGGNTVEGFYALAVTTTNNVTVPDFTATATPVAGRAQASDGDCTSMTITHLGVKGGLPANNACW